MAVPCRWILVLTLLFAAELRLAAESAEDRAFRAARAALQDTVYDRAEAGFADFCQKYPASPRLSEAILLQAEARLELTNYAGAIALLSAHQKEAGTNADQYAFWLAEAELRKGDYLAASDGFAKLVKEFPASSRLLDAVMGEASARAALAQTEPSEWPRVIGLLAQTNGVFQSAMRTNAGLDLVVQGQLLLSEAQLATKDYRAAEASLQPLSNRGLSPRLTWQWQYLLCQIQLADGRTNAALQTTTNLMVTAKNAQTNLLAESAAFQANLFERLGHTNEAIAAYQTNLAEGIPAERRRQALLKITELYLGQNQIRQAMQKLEEFLGQYPKAAAADLALLTLGELRLRRYEADLGANPGADGPITAPGATNDLQLALASFNTLVKEFPQSPLFGKAQLDLGWCYWRAGNMLEGQAAAFQAAVERLPFSKDLATAYFWLADTQFQQTNYAGAIKNYQAILDKFGALPEVRTNLFEPALYQKVLASVAEGDLATATNTLQNMLAWYSNRLDTARAVLKTGQETSRRGDPAGARTLFLDFTKTVPDAPLQPELQLAVAATYEQEKKWPEAIAQYDSWLGSYSNHVLRPRAEYYRALDTSDAGRKTNALTAFTNLVARFPTSEFAPLAQWWVANYYYSTGEPLEAERNYKLIFQSTNWGPSDLTYRAQLMAARAAVAGQVREDAKTYFLGLYNNTNGPSIDLRVEAFFDYGRTLMLWGDPAETNKLANYEVATRVFGRICDDYPTNRFAVPAWINKANCYLQTALAKQQYDSLTNALDAYQRAVDSPQADLAARSEAKVGRATVLTKWAEQKTGAERSTLLKQALSNCLDVFYATSTILHDGESPDPKWTKEAGTRAIDLAEELQAWSQLANIYTRLTNSVWPQLPAAYQMKATKAFEALEREKANR